MHATEHTARSYLRLAPNVWPGRRKKTSARPDYGLVAASNAAKCVSASVREDPHIELAGRRPAQKAGRSGRPKIAHRMSGSSCTHGIPAGLPCGIPGIGEVIEGAMQHAPQFERQSMAGLSHENIPKANR